MQDRILMCVRSPKNPSTRGIPDLDGQAVRLGWRLGSAPAGGNMRIMKNVLLCIVTSSIRFECGVASEPIPGGGRPTRGARERPRSAWASIMGMRASCLAQSLGWLGLGAVCPRLGWVPPFSTILGGSLGKGQGIPRTSTPGSGPGTPRPVPAGGSPSRLPP